MAKKKSKKGKKKSQKKQRKQQKEEKNELPEVTKELYEIQISDLNSKLERVKQQCLELESENVQIRENLTQVNDDRADVIAYLKRLLKTKTQDIVELEEQVTTLQQARELENSQFSEKFSSKEEELKLLHEQLTTEINLLNGKLNVLDEFRLQKEELTRKFEQQEEAQKFQELQHQETLHNIERDFILKKIQMKKEVEERLIRLSEDFQTIMQSKIDSTTRVTIIENDALKTEMKKLMNTCKELIKENNSLKTSERQIKIRYALLKEELDSSIRKYIWTKKSLQEVVNENETLKSEVARIDVNQYLVQIQKLTDNLNEYKDNLHKQMKVNRELGEKVSFYENEERVLRDQLSSSLSRIKTIEDVISRASQVIREILSNENDQSKIDYNCRTRFASSMLEILKTSGIDDKSDLLPNLF